MRFLAIASLICTAVLGVFASPVVERKTLKSLATFVTDLTDTVEPLSNLLLDATHATESGLTSTIGNIDAAVTDAVNNLKELVGQSSDVIMASANGTSVLSASDIASLLGDVVKLIFTAANATLSVVDATDYPTIEPLLVTLGEAVFSLLSISVTLNSGILVPLLPFLVPVLSTIGVLGLTALFGSL